MNLEVYRELVQDGLASVAGTNSYLTPWRTQTAIYRSDYAGRSLAWSFEIVATNSDTDARTVELVYSTTINNRTTLASVATISVPASTTSLKRFSSVFIPYSALGYYYVRVQGSTSDSQVTVTEARVRVAITHATKAVVEIPLVAANYGTTSNEDDNTVYADRVLSTSWTRSSDVHYARWQYVASDWADIVNVKVQHILSTADSDYPAYSGIVIAGDTTLLTGSDTPANTVVHPNLVNTTVAASSLTDGMEYEAAIQGSSAEQFAYVHSVSLLVRLSNGAGLSKVPVWLRVARASSCSTNPLDFYPQRAVLNSANYSGTVTYATEVTGLDDTSELTYGVADYGTTDSGGASSAMSGTQVTLGSERGRVRTAPWTPPQSGNRVGGYKEASTGTPSLAGIFIVITVVDTTSGSTGKYEMVVWTGLRWAPVDVTVYA